MQIFSKAISPSYSQVAVFDPDVPDAYPTWEEGSTIASATGHGIAVATISDLAGDVGVIVTVNEPTNTDEEQILFSGTIASLNGRLLVGSVTGGDLSELDVTPGSHNVRVTTSGVTGQVSDVTFHLYES